MKDQFLYTDLDLTRNDPATILSRNQHLEFVFHQDPLAETPKLIIFLLNKRLCKLIIIRGTVKIVRRSILFRGSINQFRFFYWSPHRPVFFTICSKDQILFIVEDLLLCQLSQNIYTTMKFIQIPMLSKRIPVWNAWQCLRYRNGFISSKRVKFNPSFTLSDVRIICFFSKGFLGSVDIETVYLSQSSECLFDSG